MSLHGNGNCLGFWTTATPTHQEPQEANERVQPKCVCNGSEPSSLSFHEPSSLLYKLHHSTKSPLSVIHALMSASSRRRLFSDWYELLHQFHTQHGHCRVKRSCPGYEELSRWVNRIRKAKKNGKVKEGQVEMLNRLGFDWNVIGPRYPFEDALELLRQFKCKHGHCCVPYTYPPNQKLATWAHNQRAQYSRKLRNQRSYMTDENIAELKKVGLFDFKSRDVLVSFVNMPDDKPRMKPLCPMPCDKGPLGVFLPCNVCGFVLFLVSHSLMLIARHMLFVDSVATLSRLSKYTSKVLAYMNTNLYENKPGCGCFVYFVFHEKSCLLIH